MKVKTAIVEDNKTHADTLMNLLNRYAKDNGIDLEVTVFTDGYDIAEKYTAVWDLVFMDIEMKLMNGMEAAELIRRADPMVVLVFITTNPHYAISGYRVGALDYLLKPVSYQSLSFVMRQALTRIREGKKEAYLTVNTRSGISRLRISDILWIESENHRITFHTEEGSWDTTTVSLSELEEKLQEEGFFRASRWQIINLSKVREMKNGCVILGGASFPVSKSRQGELIKALTERF